MIDIPNKHEKIQDRERAEKWLRQLFKEGLNLYKRKSQFRDIHRETGVSIHEIEEMDLRIAIILVQEA